MAMAIIEKDLWLLFCTFWDANCVLVSAAGAPSVERLIGHGGECGGVLGISK